MRRLARPLILMLIAAALLTPRVGSAAPAGRTHLPSGPRLAGTDCHVFPADNVWNTPVTGLPVAPESGRWLAAMGASHTFLHPDFGPSGTAVPYGIPWSLSTPREIFAPVHFTYADQSDPGPYPLSTSTPIEGGPEATGDRHALVVDPRTCALYELYDATYHRDGGSTAGSGAIWNLRSDRLRPAGWTSADAAGLPILPGLLRYDEVMSGHVEHAIRMTAAVTATRYLWPARHEAGVTSSPDAPPMGARFRLSAHFHLPAARCGHACQTVVRALQVYGAILADNGSDWFIGGTADRRWSDALLTQLEQIPGSAFQAVDERCLMLSPDSGAARQPGTPAWQRAC